MLSSISEFLGWFIWRFAAYFFVFYKPEKSTKENDKSAAIEALLSFLYVKFTEVLMKMSEK